MFGILRGIHRDQVGAALVEMALVLSLLLLLLAGVVDFGRAFHGHIIITNASREGARYGSRFPFHPEGIVNAVKHEVAESGVPPESVLVTIDPAPPQVTPDGQPIRITATYELPTVWGGIIGTYTLTLRSTAEMVVFSAPH